MRRVIGLSLILFLAAGGSLAAAGEEKIVLQINENSSIWSGDDSPKKEGGQNLVYFSAAYLKKKYGVTFLGSYANTSYIYNGGQPADFSLSSLTDSTISGYYKFSGIKGFDIRAGLDLNLPTGKAGFTDSQFGALFTDNVVQELNVVNFFGGGLNIAPNVVATKSLANMTLGLGLRYELTGKYDPTTETPNDDYDPGDLLTFIGSGMLRPNNRSLIVADLRAAMSTRDRRGGEDFFKQGNVYNLNLRYVRKYDTFRATLFGSYGMQDKNQRTGATAGTLTTEDRNTNNNKYELYTHVFYNFTSKVGISGILGYKDVQSNNAAGSLKDAGYDKIYLGGGGTFTISDVLFWTAELRLFQVNNGADAQEAQSTKYNGFNFDIGLVYTFNR
ncbi:MAG: hypothetical protein ACE5EN_02960 [Nitrospinota bacterium]